MHSGDHDSSGHENPIETPVQLDGEMDVDRRPAYPSVTTHPYETHDLNEPIVLYRGAYCLPPTDPDDLAYHGVIELRWLPEPEIVAHGERRSDLQNLALSRLVRQVEPTISAWATVSSVRLPDDSKVPPMPASAPEADGPETPASGVVEQMTTMIFPPEFGDGSALTCVTGLVANGFDAWDGSLVAAPSGWWSPMPARTTGIGGGWVATLDSAAMSGEAWKALEGSRGYQVTQVVDLRRVDGSDFSAREAMPALEVIGYALTIALGRHLTVMLPIGWRSEVPVWTRWGFRGVDPFRTMGTWLDHSVMSVQVGELIGRILESWDDELRRDTLRDAASYLVQGQSGHAELGITLPISGLTLLSYSHLVEELGTHSKRRWTRLGVAGQIRALVTSLRSMPDLTVPADLVYLEALRARLAAKSSEPDLDGLGCIIKMRNAVMHPTRGERADWTYEEIIEGFLFATHLFEMTLLAYAGYRGRVHPRIASEQMAGYLEDVPWVTPSSGPVAGANDSLVP